MSLSKWDLHEVCSGRSLIRLGKPDLESDPAVWESAWRQARDEALAYWISRHPGSRPRSFWEFEPPLEPRHEGESEPEYLDRLGLLEPGELEAITGKARQLIRHNRSRDPGRSDGFIEPDALARFAARAGLLSPDDLRVLHLDAERIPA